MEIDGDRATLEDAAMLLGIIELCMARMNENHQNFLAWQFGLAEQSRDHSYDRKVDIFNAIGLKKSALYENQRKLTGELARLIAEYTSTHRMGP